MNHKKQYSKAISLKIQVHDGRFSLQLSLPLRWLVTFASAASALLAQPSIIRLLGLISQALR